MMEKYYHAFSTEFREHYKWILAWFLGLHSYTVLAVLLYPGEAALQDFLGLLDEPYFAAFIGQIGGQDPGYALWVGLLLPFSTVAIFIYGLMMGVRVASKSISDETGELIHTMPVQRYTLLTIRWLVGILGAIVIFLVFIILLRIPFVGEVIDLEVLITASWWGLLFVLMASGIGMLLGLVAADTGRGNQLALLLSVTLYGLELISRVVPRLEDLRDFNPLAWYRPEVVIWGGDIPDGLLLKTLFLLVFTVGLSYITFEKRDLIVNAPLSIPILSQLVRSRKHNDQIELNGEPVIGRKKSDRDSIFTSWVRPLEQRFPFTADFIYSERMSILIMFWLVIMIYPGQLLAYDPTNEAFVKGLEDTISSFGNTGIMKVFTYGHDLSNNLYLWLLITQAIGLHYFFFVPLTAHWIKKILLSDTENETGELMASLPVKEHRVLLQRLFAVFLEMVLISTIMVIWLLIIEAYIGVSENQIWEILAIYSTIPLYIFLLTAGLSLGLLMKDGVNYARYGLLVLLLLFVASILSDTLAVIQPFTVYGLYDPVLLIMDATFAVQHYGVLILSGLAALSTWLIFLLSDRFSWVRVVEHGKLVVHNHHSS